MVSIVNGYLCKCDCDVALAKRGVNPQNPTDDPGKTRDGKPAAGAASDRGPAVLRDGQLGSGLDPSGVAPGPGGAALPEGGAALPQPGTLVDRTA